MEEDFPNDVDNHQDYDIPIPPPIPAPYIPEMIEEEAELKDFLTADCLSNVTLQKAKPLQEVKKTDSNLSMLELAVKRRAEKLVDSAEIEGAGELIKRLEDIRFLRTFKEQIALVEEAKRLESKLENGGPAVLKRSNFPQYDVHNLASLIKSDQAIHSILLNARKVVNDGKVEGLESLIMQLIGISQTLEKMRKINFERYGLRLRIDMQEEGSIKYSTLLLHRIYDDAFARLHAMEGKMSASKFGFSYNANKIISLLQNANRISKKMASIIKALPEEQKNEFDAKAVNAQKIIKNLENVDLKSLSGSIGLSTSSEVISNAIVSNSKCDSNSNSNNNENNSASLILKTPEKISTLSQEQLVAPDVNGNTALHIAASTLGSICVVNEFLKNRFLGCVGIANIHSGQTPLHNATTEALLAMLKSEEHREEILKALEKKSTIELDTPLSALCKRSAMAKKEEHFLECLMEMIRLCPASLRERDNFGRLPLSTLSIKLSPSISFAKDFEASQSFPMSFDRYMFSDTLSDVSLKLDSGDMIPAHRIVLCAQSSSLRALLEESKFVEGSRNIVELRDVDPDALKLVFNYLYCGTAAILPHQELVGVKGIQLADQWLLPQLVSLLCGQLMKMISLENCFLLSCCLDQMELEVVQKLRCAAAVFALKEYETLAEYDEEFEHLTGAIQCLAAHSLK